MKIKILILRLFFSIGKGSFISYRTILYSPHRYIKNSLVIRDNVGIGHDCDIDYSGGLEIKENVWISERVIIATHEHKVLNVNLIRSQ